ncbi:hypothetical protein ACFOKI_15840 [Sphingomonas qilianensis]|uniref:hypothetical protein n=1 Tax=Sphingomonas qilianensis TaxID=1736690 RepID=UPI0036061319
MDRWDGNDYQTWTRLAIGCSVIGLIVERFRPSGELFVMCIMFVIIGIVMVPEGPKPPPD